MNKVKCSECDNMTEAGDIPGHQDASYPICKVCIKKGWVNVDSEEGREALEEDPQLNVLIKKIPIA